MNTPQTHPQFSLQQLSQLIELSTHFTGEKPKTVTVSQECLDWFTKQTEQVIENFNIPTTKNYKKPMFMKVELVVKE